MNQINIHIFMEAKACFNLMKDVRSVVPRYEWIKKRDTAFAINSWGREIVSKLMKIECNDPEEAKQKEFFLQQHKLFQGIVFDLTWAYL